MATPAEYPMGFKFLPSDNELITCYLTGLVAPLPDCIIQQDIYSVEPQSLNWDYVPYLNDYERYYFVKRSQVAKKNGDGVGVGGKNVNRSVGCGVGFWRMSCGRDIKDSQNKVIGHCQSLNYYRYTTTQQHSTDHRNKIRNKAEKTQWLMHEYTFATDKFQEWVICRIKDQDKERGVKKGRYNIKRRRRQADHDDAPPAQRPRHAHHNQTSIDLADHGGGGDDDDDDDDYANQLEHQIQAFNDLADHGGDDDYHDPFAPPASMSECSIISQSPPPPVAEHIHQLDQPQDDDVDFYLQNLAPLEEAEDHQTPQYLFQSDVPVFDDDDDNFKFVFDSGCDNQNYEDQADDEA